MKVHWNISKPPGSFLTTGESPGLKIVFIKQISIAQIKKVNPIFTSKNRWFFIVNSSLTI